jgi:hypothetical protein
MNEDPRRKYKIKSTWANKHFSNEGELLQPELTLFSSLRVIPGTGRNQDDFELFSS